MPPWVERYLQSIREFYDRMDQRQRRMLLAGIILVPLAIIGFFLYALKPQYVVLYSNLMKSDSQAITTQLDSMKVPYKLEQNGTAILVPRNQVDAARIKLAQEGLPSSNGVGLEFLNTPSFYDTDQTLTLKYLRAQETELERTISQIQGIEWARVHLVTPKQSIFVEKEEKPTAAVEVQLSPGAHLSSSQVRAIVSLVAHSVEGLTPDNVSVIDTEGNLLSNMLSESESPTKLTMGQLEIQQKFETNLQNKLQSLLDDTLGLSEDGFHRAYVQVKASLDFDSKIIDQTSYFPLANGKGIIRSTQTSNEQLRGQKPLVGGVPGTTSNIPGYPAAANAPVTYTKEMETSNYEITSQKEHIKPPVGVNVHKLDVAVAVDSTNVPVNDYPEIKGLIASAAGINAARGDTLAVEPLPFDETYRKKMAEQLQREESTQKIEYGFTHMLLPALLIAAVVVIILLALSKREKREEAFAPPSEMMPPSIPPEFFTPPPPQPVEEERVERKKMMEKMKQKGEEKAALREDVEEFITSSPGASAELIRSWLFEREGERTE